MSGTNESNQTAVDGQRFEDRRAFLKKAGLGVAGLGALWVAPQVTSVGARPAYAAVTSPPCTFETTYPADGATLEPDPTNFTWPVYPGAAHYLVAVSRFPCGGSGSTPINNIQSSTSRNVDLSTFAGGPGSWSVTPMDAQNNPLCDPVCKSFTVNDL